MDLTDYAVTLALISLGCLQIGVCIDWKGDRD